MKTCVSLALALLGFGTAVVQTLDARDARRHEAQVEARESEVVTTLTRVIEAHAEGCRC